MRYKDFIEVICCGVFTFIVFTIGTVFIFHSKKAWFSVYPLQTCKFRIMYDELISCQGSFLNISVFNSP